MDMSINPLNMKSLEPERLCRRCDPANFAFRTTADLEDLEGFFGQARALGAIEFGVGMRREGYNLFAMGPEGLGRHTIVRRELETQARRLPAPSDWCYVFNFKTPHRPRALSLPPGQAAAFRAGMQRLVEDLRAAVPAAFETDEYRSRRKRIEDEFGSRQERMINDIGERARAQGVALVRTPSGFGFGPFVGEGVMEPEQFAKLPAKEQERLQRAIDAFQEELEKVLAEMPKRRRETLRKLRDLHREITRVAVRSLIEELKSEYRALPQVQNYLREVEDDMIEHAEAFRQSKNGEPMMLFGIPVPQAEATETIFRRYAVNVLIEHSATAGAPIVYEDKPSHDALVGRTEHIAQMGTLVTDFSLIKAGALHRANGGYLILDALKLLTEPFAWEALKRALRSREIRIQSLGQELSLIATVSLDPEPIPLDLKVVLVGQRLLYYLLHAYDPEFAELFKVAADFDEDMARDPATDLLYARLVATLARKERLRHLDAGAVARVIEQSSRDAADAEKLSASMQGLVDLIRESDYWAAGAGHDVIRAEDVARAIRAQIERSGRIRQRLLENVLRGTHLIDTTGARAGQVNGLAVTELGSFRFGAAQRITARVRLGGNGVVDLERESDLGGRIHSKGVMILAGYLAGRYATGKPLSLSATLVFEQNYGGVEGDSASSAELCALLSALADTPIAQSLAVTGSVNQHGDVQAIGGVNEKIEGFFDLCRARGLTGEQGVLIPEANVKNLMLREDVVAAVREGKFRIHAVRTIDEGISLLTGLPAADVHARVEERLTRYAEKARSFAAEGVKKALRSVQKK
jgi:lon-related putative ATP-dependent protease